MKNPAWNNEELILALELYFSLSYGQMDGKNPKVKALSRFLTLMNEENGYRRSVNSISLKLANFKRIDPDFTGKGMTGGGKNDELIWNQYSADKNQLTSLAKKIKENVLKRQKGYFIKWLENNNKPDGSPYKKRTILTYASQIENNIIQEFNILCNFTNLYEVTDLDELEEINKQIDELTDSKRKKDLRSAFHCYHQFIKTRYYLDEPDTVADPREEEESYTEGGRKVYISTRIERNRKLRIQAIQIHGTTCMACGFNFSLTYGDWGKEYIEVHHLILLGNSEIKERKTNPRTDLIVLCANCHRMIHRRKGITLTLEELKQKIRK